MYKLRLVLFEECHRDCGGCCNKDWDLKKLPVCRDFRGYDLIMLTGGEPMLRPNIVYGIIEEIRTQTKAPIYLYTALLKDRKALGNILDQIDGVTVTLHTQEDVATFMEFDNYYVGRPKMSYRLNIFKGVGPVVCLPRWNVKDDIVWIKDCPLPDGETLMRLDIEPVL